MKPPTIRSRIRTTAALATVVVIAAGCGRAGSGGSSGANPTRGSTGSSTTAAAQAGLGDFGSLKNVCHGGSATGATDQGVTSGQIKLGVFTDVGFTHDPQLVYAASVFASWCNAAGGIDGRKIVPDTRDTKLFNVAAQMAGACGADFALVGGSAAFDGLGVKQRLQCLLPDFPAQPVDPQNYGSDLQVYPITYGHSYNPFAGYYQWLITQQYPDSAKHLGVLWGDESVTQVTSSQQAEALHGEGGTVVYNASFPVIGLSNWTPYAEALKNKGVKGLVFEGTPQWLAALEQTMVAIDYKPDWIDTSPDDYGTTFVQTAGSRVLSFEHNYAGLDGEYPLEKDQDNPATRQLVSLFAQYAQGQPVTLQDLQGWSAWLLFGVSAETCGSDLTRKCVYDAAITRTAWTGGGLTSPVDLSKPDSPPACWNAEQASPSGWQPASFHPNDGAYRCGAPVYKYTGSYPQPPTLSSVGKSLADLR